MATNYYQKYLAEGRCTKCGGYMPPEYKYKECERCRIYKKLLRKRKKAEADARREAEERCKKQVYTLDELSRMARERGISYGQLVCELDGSRSGAEKDKVSSM